MELRELADILLTGSNNLDIDMYSDISELISNIGMYSDIYKLIWCIHVIMTENNVLILVYMTLTLIQGHWSAKKQKLSSPLVFN